MANDNTVRTYGDVAIKNSIGGRKNKSTKTTNMAHKGTYGGKKPSKKEKKEAEAMHKMPSGKMMTAKEMEAMKKKKMKEMYK